MIILRKEGWILNPNDKIVNSLFKAIERNNGECPCAHPEWNENTPKEDKMCPCIGYREQDKCCCKLYLKEASIA